MTALALLLGLGAAAGCGGDAPTGSVAVTLGTTAADLTGFYPLTGDQPLVPGAQGGFHVWLTYRVSGMVGEVEMQRRVRRVSDGALILTAHGVTEMVPPDGTDVFTPDRPLPSFMCPTPIGVRVMDEPVHFELTLTTHDGKVLGSAEAEATPRCPSGDAEAFCLQICSG